jgi:hypothetical protein
VVCAHTKRVANNKMAFGSLFTVLVNFLIGQEFRQAFQLLPGGVWDYNHSQNTEITAAIPLGYGQKYFEDNYRVTQDTEMSTMVPEGVRLFNDPADLVESIFKRLNNKILAIKNNHLADLAASMTSGLGPSFEAELSAMLFEQVEEVSKRHFLLQLEIIN